MADFTMSEGTAASATDTYHSSLKPLREHLRGFRFLAGKGSNLIDNLITFSTASPFGVFWDNILIPPSQCDLLWTDVVSLGRFHRHCYP